MRTSAQLEQEAEQTRTALARNLDELRARISPGYLVDQAVDYAKESTGGEFYRNLTRQVAANPFPVILIGAGVAWLALAKASSSPTTTRGAPDPARDFQDAQGRTAEGAQQAGEAIGEWASQASTGARNAANYATDIADSLRTKTEDTRSGMISKINETASSVRDEVSSTFESAKERTTSAAASAQDTASAAYERASDIAGRANSTVAGSAGALGQKWSDAVEFCKGQPLLLAGLGLTIGGVLGAIIPRSDTEDTLMGETSDRLKNQAQETAHDQIDNAKEKEVVQSSIQQANEAVGQVALESKPQREKANEGAQGKDVSTSTLVPEEGHFPGDEPVE